MSVTSLSRRAWRGVLMRMRKDLRKEECGITDQRPQLPLGQTHFLPN